jgi:tetratricopeptide (TPR) repeat protein
VQTTCPAWFAVLGDDAMRRAALRQTLGEAAVGADLAPTAGRRLDDTGLTAIVYYNRGLDYLEAGRFAESLAANQTALRLDPQNATAHANLLATLNNWSLDRYRRGDVAEAVRLLEQGLAIDPHYALFRENLAAVRGQTKIAP